MFYATFVEHYVNMWTLQTLNILNRTGVCTVTTKLYKIFYRFVDMVDCAARESWPGNTRAALCFELSTCCLRWPSCSCPSMQHAGVVLNRWI